MQDLLQQFPEFFGATLCFLTHCGCLGIATNSRGAVMANWNPLANAIFASIVEIPPE
jgi:hypothetical protein